MVKVYVVFEVYFKCFSQCVNSSLSGKCADILNEYGPGSENTLTEESESVLKNQ